MTNHFLRNPYKRPGILSNRIPIRKNPGTFVRIPQKVVGYFSEDTDGRTYVRILEKMTNDFLRNPYKRPEIIWSGIMIRTNPELIG